MDVTEEIKSLKPTYRWGEISPRDRGSVIRGPGYEFYRLLPLDIIQIQTVLGIADYSAEAVNVAIERFWDCVARLERERVDHVVLDGVPVAAGLGRARVLALLAEAEKRTGVPFDAALEAVIASMEHLGLTRLAVASRWAVDLNASASKYLAEAGIEVVTSTALGMSASASQEMTFDEGLQMALDLAREVAGDGRAEAIFVPGHATMSLQVIDAVEGEFGKPVLTNLTTQIWNGLIGPGVIPPIQGFGQLLASS